MQHLATNTSGMTAKWIARGATLTELHVPDQRGVLADVVLGFDEIAGYASPANQYFGCTTGRYANRICGGKFSLDGKQYQLAVNNGPNHLHGGPTRGLDKVDWQAEPLDDGVRFTYTSPAGEEGFPGQLSLAVTYTLTDTNDLEIDYQATTDEPTIINLTNHTYFNLAGHGSDSILDHELWIDADRYTPTDQHAIPTGELAVVENTPFDFRHRKRIGENFAAVAKTPAGGYDHNYVLNSESDVLRKIAEVFDPTSRRVMHVLTDQPGVQFYTGNGLHGQTGKGGKTYTAQSALCLETQHFPDSPNQPDFPTTVLQPGNTYRHRCVYAFSANS
ncbi:MAG: galactose mutarotase [Pirellulales bacterium]|nr:galactose mutarotase [Pirellulales bacterium]